MNTVPPTVTFNAVASIPGGDRIVLGTIEANEEMTPDIAMSIITPYIQRMGDRCGGHIITIYRAEDEGIDPYRARGIVVGLLVDNRKVLLHFTELPLSRGRDSKDA